MYCTDCGSALCKEWGKLCILSEAGKALILDMLESQFIDNSFFNKYYSFVPTETWDDWALNVGLPTQDELMLLYPGEDLESLLYLVLEDMELSPELRSFYHEPFDAEPLEAEAFSEFNENWTFEGKHLTKEELMRYNKKPVRALPRPDYVKLRREFINE